VRSLFVVEELQREGGVCVSFTFEVVSGERGRGIGVWWLRRGRFGRKGAWGRMPLLPVVGGGIKSDREDEGLFVECDVAVVQRKRGFFGVI